jgi:hypothetical protein
VDVVGRRDERVEVAGFEPALLLERELAVEDVLVLRAAVEADEAPREVVVDRRLGAARDDEREQRQRAVAGAEQQPLADPAAHAALRVALLVALGQPVRIGQQLGEARADRVAGDLWRRRLGDRRADIGNEPADRFRVQEILVAVHDG